MIDKRWSQVKRVLAIRLDNLGDVLVTTPALHAIKTSLPAATLTLLASPVGAQVARLNPDLDDVIVYQAPWMDPWHKLPQDSQREQQMIATIRERRFDGAIIFTSFRQSPLPAAYLCYLADIPLRVASSIDGPGSLLTTRHKNPPITSDKGGIDETSRSGFQVLERMSTRSSEDLTWWVPLVSPPRTLISFCTCPLMLEHVSMICWLPITSTNRATRH